MNLAALASDIASRVRSFQSENIVNNETVILGILERELCPVEELRGKYPAVLFFDTQEDLDEFWRMVKESKPWMKERKL